MPASYKGSIFTAAITSIACMGDTILYSVLPVYADAIGISDFWIGFLLSINRFVRLISHGIIASFIIRFGLKNVVLFSSIGAALSTFSYKTPTFIFLFAGARMVWGIAYSGFRQAILYYAANVAEKREKAFALSNVVRSVGPFLILIIAPFIFNKMGYENSFILIGFLSSLGIVIALFLPKIKIETEEYKYRNVLAISWFKILLFLISFIADGFIVVVLFILFSNKSLSPKSLLITVSYYLLLKRMISFLLPLSFLKSYSVFTVNFHFNIGTSLVILGLVLLSQGFYILGLIILFTGATIAENAAPLVGLGKSGMQKLEVITSVTLWWDIGKALGAFVGILMYKNLGGNILFLTFGLVLVFVLTMNIDYKCILKLIEND